MNLDRHYIAEQLFTNPFTERNADHQRWFDLTLTGLQPNHLRYRWLIVLILLGACMAGCNYESNRSKEPVVVIRGAAAVLSEQDARARSLRLSNTSYQLTFELDGESPEFPGSVEMRFNLSKAEEPLTVDFVGGKVQRIAVNGVDTAIDYNGYFIHLSPSELRNGLNVVEIDFSHPYSNDGSGLYRFRDPLDGRDYLYTDFEPYDANRLFPCFDQPDLKATYATNVTVPSEWEVISIVQESAIEKVGNLKRWTFPESARISTYIYALHAGNYVSWSEHAGNIPLRLFARASMSEFVRTEDWFTPTKQGFEFFQSYFDIPYPFSKYDQVIVPHFNAGAMENLGAVTYSERFLTRGQVTRPQRRSLASVIMHEMAHMWFGNLVTMDWWNGLWLNEAFATFMANLALENATEFKDVSVSAFQSDTSAYRADERETSHPIEQPTPNTDAAFANFDAITYNKGSAVLSQLRHLVGPDKFRDGVSKYLKRHSYGNTTIDDFLSAIGESADIDLKNWAETWLNQPGTNGVSVDYTCDETSMTSLALHQSAPSDWPILRTHRAQLGLYTFTSVGVEEDLLPVTYTGARTQVPVDDISCPDATYANHGNWDFVRVDFDQNAMNQLANQIATFDDPLQRSMLWYSIYEMVLYQRIPPNEFIRFTIESLPGEPNDDVKRQVLGSMMSAWSYVRRLAPEKTVNSISKSIETFLWDRLSVSQPGSDRQLHLFDTYTSAVTTSTGLARLASFLAEGSVPAGIQFDHDRRWNVLQTLTAHDHPNAPALLEEQMAIDTSDSGRLRVLAVQASRPDQAHQRLVMNLLLDPPSELTVYEARAHARGLFPFEHQDAQLQITQEVLARLQDVSDRVDVRYYGAIFNGLLGSICDDSYLAQVESAVNNSSALHPSMRKRLLDTRFQVRRCLAIGEAMAANAQLDSSLQE